VVHGGVVAWRVTLPGGAGFGGRGTAACWPGWSPADLAKLAGRNVLRVLRGAADVVTDYRS